MIVKLLWTYLPLPIAKLEYVLKWYTPLEGIAGKIFRVERAGQVIPYQGILASRAVPTPDAYVALDAGESVSAEVDLATAYDFSKAGEYTIEFLSPSISHVARTEAQMAKTMDDLGPVQIPSNRITIRIGGSLIEPGETVEPPETDLEAPTPTPALPPLPGETVEPPGTDLEATIEVPATLTSGEAVKLRFTLTNNTDTSLYVLKWYTPLEGIAGEIFRVERDGQVLPYEGILAYRGDPTPDAYVSLDAGESVSAEVDLATAYDFSKAGEYTIEFLSPSISHVARTEAEMAKTVDDLGPVEMPSNQVAVEIGASSDSPVHRSPAEALRMIQDYLRRQKPDLNPDLHLAVEEVPVPKAWENMRAQVFRITEGPFANESFLIRRGSVLSIGTAVGGRGITSVEIADLDRDDRAELLFTYSFGSGIHQSRIGMYAPAHSEHRTYEAATGYLGDLGLFKEHMSTVGVRVVESDDATLTLHRLDTLGYLAIEGQQ